MDKELLEFGIFDHLERPRDASLAVGYDQRLRLLTRAEQFGFYAYHLAEHNQSPLCMAPSQNVCLGAAARVTQQLRLGTLVHLLLLYHPLRLIDEIACSTT